MTRVDFYLLQNADPAEKPRLACKLAEKAFQRGLHTYIYTADANASAALDDLLWLYAPGSFVPHARHDDSAPAIAADDAPVLIGHTPPPEPLHQLLISLAPSVPEFFSRFERLIEVVANDDDDKARSRERFRFYRDRGYPLQTHNV